MSRDKPAAVANFDGLCEPAYAGGPRNPGGIACGGWIVLPSDLCAGLRNGLMGNAEYGRGPGTTNNMAEYNAALDCLRAIYRAGWRGAVIMRGDSQLVVRQVTGAWNCNADHLRVLRDQVRHAITFFESVTLLWVPREENEGADRQSRLAYEYARKRKDGAA